MVAGAAADGAGLQQSNNSVNESKRLNIKSASRRLVCLCRVLK